MILSNINTLVLSFLISVVGSRCVAFIPHTLPRSDHLNIQYGKRGSAISTDEHTKPSILPTERGIDRRDFFSVTGIFGTGLLTSILFPQMVSGTTSEELNVTTSSILSATDIANLLHTVPTFTIVDTEGIPYMVVGEDARVTGYFFTTYTEAQRILTLARTSVDQSIREEIAKLKSAKIMSNNLSSPMSDPELLFNPWSSARISTVPLDAAITLSLKGLNGNVRNYFQVAAAETDINDALKITNKSDLAEGKVPLFYFADFTLDTKIPLYFQKDQLIVAYRKQHPRKALPTILVTELFAVLTSMATHQQASNNDEDDIQSIIFVPPINSEQWVRQCTTNNEGKPPFVLGKRNIVL